MVMSSALFRGVTQRRVVMLSTQRCVISQKGADLRASIFVIKSSRVRWVGREARMRGDEKCEHVKLLLYKGRGGVAPHVLNVGTRRR
jgi:hypothetical protein